MIRKLKTGWYICYDANGEPFDGPHRSQEAAQQALDGLRPVDRMLVSGRAPASRTDREFLIGTENGRQFQDEPASGDAYRKVCENAGGSVTGKKYLRQLARFPGDPQAWVSGRGDVQRLCEQRGWASEGLVTVKGREVEPTPPVGLDERIVAREAAKIVGPRPTKKKLERAKEDIRNKMTPRWKK